LVAVTTETELGVATPWIVSGTGGVGTEGGGGEPDDGGVLDEAPPPPQAVMRHNSAAKPAA